MTRITDENLKTLTRFWSIRRTERLGQMIYNCAMRGTNHKAGLTDNEYARKIVTMPNDELVRKITERFGKDLEEIDPYTPRCDHDLEWITVGEAMERIQAVLARHPHKPLMWLVQECVADKANIVVLYDIEDEELIIRLEAIPKND